MPVRVRPRAPHQCLPTSADVRRALSFPLQPCALRPSTCAEVCLNPEASGGTIGGSEGRKRGHSARSGARPAATSGRAMPPCRRQIRAAVHRLQPRFRNVLRRGATGCGRCAPAYTSTTMARLLFLARVVLVREGACWCWARRLPARRVGTLRRRLAGVRAARALAVGPASLASAIVRRPARSDRCTDFSTAQRHANARGPNHPQRRLRWKNL